MAPVSRDNGTKGLSNSEMNGAAKSNDAPPSTLAANLVNNLPTTRRPSKNAEQEDFQRLLAEVSKYEESAREDDSTEAVIEHHHKRIYVVVKAVLEVLTKDEPFTNEQDMLQKASDGLEILVATIKETPAVLVHIAGSGSGLHSGANVPLWIWLFPQLLSLVGQQRYGTLQKKLSLFFMEAFGVASRSSQLWALNSSFFCYVRHCVNATLARLNEPHLIVDAHCQANLGLVLPLVNIEEEIQIPGRPDLLMEACTYTLTDVRAAFRHISYLMSIIVDISSVTAVSYDNTVAFQGYQAWILENMMGLRDLEQTYTVTSAHCVDWEFCAMHFDSVHLLLTSLDDILPVTMKRKGYRLLAILCADLVIEYPHVLTESFRQAKFCSVLLSLAAVSMTVNQVSQAVSTRLVPGLKKLLGSHGGSINFSSDLLNSVSLLVRQYSGQRNFSHTHSLSSLAPQLDDSDLNSDTDRPAKRHKVSPRQDILKEVIEEVYSLLGSQKASDLDGLSQVAPTCFVQLNNNERCQAMKLLGYVPCASCGTLNVNHDEENALSNSSCAICDNQPSSSLSSDCDYDDSNAQEAILSFNKILELPEFEQSRRPRVVGMIALRSFALHYKNAEFLNLETSKAGQWCLRSLRSSMRELRITAGRTLPSFLREEIGDKILSTNRTLVFTVLRSLSDESPMHLTETCIMAWSQIGRVSSDQELNLVLLRLVEYLGHTNQIASAVAFNEIVFLAEALGIPIWQLFSPFWRNIGHTIVKDLQSRPQTSQLMADLMGVSVASLLITTQRHTLPWLVLTKNKEVISRIAQARQDKDLSETIMKDSANLGSIMALLLVQDVPHLERFIMDLLRHLSPHFDTLDLVHLLRSAPIQIAEELLEKAGSEDDNRRGRVRVALQYLASQAYVGNDSRKNSQVGPFLEQNVLPMVAHFSDILNVGWQHTIEKRRAVKGLEEFLRIGRSYVRAALPQICASLQSALTNDELRSAGFSAWKTMVESMDDEDVGTMLENTFSTIILRWRSLDEGAQRNAVDLVNNILKKRHSLLRTFIDVIPSLDQIPELAECEKELRNMRKDFAVRQQYHFFSRRLSHENESVVTQALVELAKYLRQHQGFLQASAISEQPDIVVGELIRSVLDTCVNFGAVNPNIARLSAECIGLVGCLDSNRVEAPRARREIVVVSNFEEPDDTTDFALFILEEILVKAFLSATNIRTQGYLQYAMQELLEKCDFKEVCTKPRSDETKEIYDKWLSLPETVRQTLTPFLKSKYILGDMNSNWLKTLVLDLLMQPQNSNASLIFAPLCRVIRIDDISVGNFLLPFAILHAVVLGSDKQRDQVLQELVQILSHQPSPDSHSESTNLKLCSEAVFRILDYMSRWSQERQARSSHKRGYDSRWSHSEDDNWTTEPGVQRVADLLSRIPPEVISRRAVECESYSRALFHWEQHIRQVRDRPAKFDSTPLLERLQDIYTQIDDPDGIEGISAHLHVLDIDQQILGHRKAGRWTAAQSWYEIKLVEDPHNVDVQSNLLKCLKESGQHDVLLNYVEGMQKSGLTASRLLPFATEASWATGRWDSLEKYLSRAPKEVGGDFNISVGRTLLALYRGDRDVFDKTIQTVREQIAGSLSISTASSLSVCHDTILKFHVLTELEMIGGSDGNMKVNRQHILESLDRRLEAIGSYLNDKQYLLGIRRAAMQLSSTTFSNGDVAAAWLTSARLARKGNSMHQSFNAVLHASKLGDKSATIEHARLLFKEGHHRQAIQSLQGAIDTNAFISHSRGPVDAETNFITAEGLANQQNLLTARAHLLLAKWLDSAGQTHSSALRSQYQLAAKTHQCWEKGHYYLGRHYNKLLESEKALPSEQQAQTFIIGETAKLVIENYLRSLSYGTKYIYQTLPRVLTLWLDLGTQVNMPVDPKYGNKEFMVKIANFRKEQLNMIHSRFTKYVQKMPAYLFYTALPQIVARIAHPNTEVYKFLQQIIVKVVSAHPQQALWSLLAVCSSTQPDRKNRGVAILTALRNSTRKAEVGNYDLKSMIKMGERLSDQLLLVCNGGDFQGNRTITASITRDLGFNPKQCIPSPLAVPIESALTATLPTLTDSVRNHKAFSRDVVTVSKFLDEVLVLSSLQKPRKLTARGSDGKNYGLLCKPKDDLRKDQRLMEFNSMINRSLKRDAESSKRQLYIKTYAVTPLNEECGIIEWVDGLKTLRDILLSLYKARGISPNYGEIKIYLDEACKSDDKLPLFTDKVVRNFPPVFHSWFVQQFADPSAWFVARLKYTRSCAVMSMVGTILGLGDRHGENILFEEGNGGTFHVDFNCLFDKGLTFAQPERVPFRLTHNMVDAMGVHGYEGPFRKSAELTLRLLRQHDETLMTILEAFVHDPTLDLLAKKGGKKKGAAEGGGGGAGAGGGGVVVPDTAQGVLDSIRRKVRGLLAGESVPLGVEGQVDELIKQAVSPKNLAAMYIGWCAFF